MIAVALGVVCATTIVASSLAEPRAVPRSGDPSISGKEYLLSESDFRTLLAVARQRLAQYPYHPAVYNVLVVSKTRVKVLFRDEDGSEKGRWLLLERAKNNWKIIDEQAVAERVTF